MESIIKKTLLVFFTLSSYLGTLLSQITIQKLNSNTTVSIPLESNIRVNYPTETSNKSCECYQSYYGVLKGVDSNNLKMLVTYDERVFIDENGVNRKVRTSYAYPKQKIETILHTNNLVSVSKSNEGNKKIQVFGASIAILSVFQSLFLQPFFDGEIRKQSNKIAVGAFVLGISTAFLSAEKKYYFQQPKNKKALWLLKN